MLQKTEGIDLATRLTASERAIALAFRRMIKEHLYWGGIYIRYGVDENWQQYRGLIASLLGPGVPSEEWEPFVEAFRTRACAQMQGHGMGRHRPDEIVSLVNADLQALSDFLADKPFFMGDRPTTLDATAYGYIGNFIRPPYASPMADYARHLPNLCQHYERMTHDFFGDRESV